MCPLYKASPKSFHVNFLRHSKTSSYICLSLKLLLEVAMPPRPLKDKDKHPGCPSSSLPGKPEAHSFRLLCLGCKLLWGIVGHCFGLLGFPAFAVLEVSGNPELVFKHSPGYHQTRAPKLFLGGIPFVAWRQATWELNGLRWAELGFLGRRLRLP